MSKLYIIAEAAQGYEGSVEVSKLLIRSAKAAGADAIKFQVVYADDLAEEGYEYYGLFKSLEMSMEAWTQIREFARTQSIDFVIDVFGPHSLKLAEVLQPEGVKIHSTCFFDEGLRKKILTLASQVYLSVGGIYLEEIKSMLQQCTVQQRERFVILYGFQAEPTPLQANHLLRIPALRQETGILNIGFMDHSDGQGQHTITLSAVALGLGVRVFEKHITLDYRLHMEDYISALGVTDFANYVIALRELNEALGCADLTLREEEIAYRGRAIKRVVAKRDLQIGAILAWEDIGLNRPKKSEGFFKFSDVIGKKLVHPVSKGQAISQEVIADA